MIRTKYHDYRLILGILILFTFTTVSGHERINFEIHYTAKVFNLPQSAQRVRIWIPYPQSDEYQQIYNIKLFSKYPTYIHSDDEFGNSLLYLEIENPIDKEIEVSMNILASRVDVLNHIVDDLVGELNAQEIREFGQYFRSNLDSKEQKQVQEIVDNFIDRNAPYIQKVRALYNYVYNNMDYRKDVPGYGKGDVGRACKVGSGNCIDFHSLFVSLAQEAGVVATEVGNIDLPFEEGVPNYCAANYHCNVEVYLPNYGWIPLDISHAKKGKGSKDFYFGSLDNLRLKLGRGRQIKLSPEQEGRRIDRLLHKPYVEIDGVVFEDVEVSVLAATYDKGDRLNRRPHLIAKGEAAVPFSWLDVEGTVFNMAEFLGKKPMVINFFSTWCGRCVWETEGLNKASYDFSQIKFVRINLMEDSEKVFQFAQEKQIPYPVLADEKGELARLYGIKYVPTNIIIDANGKVFYSGGLQSEEELRNRLKHVTANHFATKE